MGELRSHFSSTEDDSFQRYESVSTNRDSSGVLDEERKIKIKKPFAGVKEWLNRLKMEHLNAIAEEDEEARAGFIGDVHEAPEFLQDEYIEHGYRIGYQGYCNVCRTLFTCSNETVNVWTHLLAAVSFVIILGALLTHAGKAVMSAQTQLKMDQNHSKLG